MTIPQSLAAHVKHVFLSSPQRDVLVRMAEAIEVLNARCACMNVVPVNPSQADAVFISGVMETATPNDDGIDPVEFEQDDPESPLTKGA